LKYHVGSSNCWLCNCWWCLSLYRAKEDKGSWIKFL